MTGWPTRFLADACGFVSTATYADEDDETVVHHAELLWPEGNVWSLGTHRGQPIP